MSTYGAMIARINDELAIPAVAARIPKAVLSAIQFYESERFWFNEGESVASTVANQQNYALPDDYLDPDVLTVTDQGIRYVLTRRPYSYYRGHQIDQVSAARPKDWAYYADQIWLYPFPEKVYTLTLSYLQRLPVLSAYADTNDWMTHGEELVRSRAKWDLLVHSAPDPKDFNMIATMERIEKRALANLRGKSAQKIASDRMSFDDGLMSTRGTYNINYQ